jgi:hypothetical protein
MIRSLCMQATMATRGFFPAFTIRAWKLEIAYFGHRERSVRTIVNGSGRSEATLVFDG